MFQFLKKKQEKKSDFELEDDDEPQDGGLVNSLKLHLSRLIAYAESADIKLQREVCIHICMFVCICMYRTIHMQILLYIYICLYISFHV